MSTTTTPAEAGTMHHRTCACQASGRICANADLSCPCDCHGAHPLAEAGTTYPLPAKPSWATESRLADDAMAHRHEVGRFQTVIVPGEQSVSEHRGEEVVEVTRWDTIAAETLTVGAALVFLLDTELTPAEARRVAVLLVEAADLLEQTPKAPGRSVAELAELKTRLDRLDEGA
jgi:hypothetical protein